jgi:4-amino-4-deoxy-L-arabinose transferase-like glycosyltransferase
LKGIEGFRVFIERRVAALTDPRRRERAIVGMLAGYALLWTLYGLLAKAGQGVQADPAEIVAWSRQLALGYAKHPPLAAWLVRAWFTLFPVTEWSYYLFDMVYACIGLWFAWHLFGRYLDAEKRVVAVALLTLVPMFNFLALRFDVNIALPPLWAATTLCFVRSFETRSAGWAALAGAAAAAAMLGKYWSLFLLIGLALAALLDQRRGVYFRSWAPWITVAVGAMLLAPHIVWLIQSGFAPLSYALNERSVNSFADALTATGKYLAGGAGYMAAPVLLAFAASRRSLVGLADTLHLHSRERRLVLVAFLIPVLLPVVVALASKTNINPIWMMPGFALLPIVLLSSPMISISRRATQAVVGIAVAFPVLMTIAAPAIALVIHRTDRNDNAMYGEMLAQRMLLEWRKATDQPLRIVGGDLDLAYVMAFYLPDAPASYPVCEPQLAPWIDAARITRQGIVLACRLEPDNRNGHGCALGQAEDNIAALLKGKTNVRRLEFELRRGIPGAPVHSIRFLTYVVPPATTN